MKISFPEQVNHPFLTTTCRKISHELHIFLAELGEMLLSMCC